MSVLVSKDLNLYYGNFQALKSVSLSVNANTVTALIGPSGCGKSTLLRVFNRMNDLIQGVKITGDVTSFGKSIFQMSVIELRKRVGMVFQRPNPFPLSVFDNIAYAPRIHGNTRKADLEKIVFECLSSVDLWDDLKEKLKTNALQLSGEQQQRLCIARLMAVKPDILLMDEPCSALDPIATARIEDLMKGLKKNYTIVIVTHNMQQAARVSDDCGFMLMGELIEFGKTTQLFTAPSEKRTEDYISGRFG
ncbi:MAG: phosphate ABC transporter ATP-binding protein [Deltaproteobacteria bacterium]|nr:phosphate ABC transporter ATP-binding protein [Deltaproteobacteria bacterium]